MWESRILAIMMFGVVVTGPGFLINTYIDSGDCGCVCKSDVQVVILIVVHGSGNHCDILG